MKKYKVNIIADDTGKIIKANSDLEAKIKFCNDTGLLYRVYFNKLETKEMGAKKNG